MADIGALEKQLNVKTRQIAELQERLDDKSHLLFDYSDTLDNKDRGIYYLERSIEARNRELTHEKQVTAELESKVRPEFSRTIEEFENKLKAANEDNEKIQEQINKVSHNMAHSTFIADTYKTILAKVDAGMKPENIVEEMQNANAQLEEANKVDKQFLADIKSAVQNTTDRKEELKGEAKFLEQYRVDAIFRVFTLKARIQSMKKKLQG